MPIEEHNKLLKEKEIEILTKSNKNNLLFNRVTEKDKINFIKYGVYAFLNEIDKIIYIGSTIQPFAHRLKEHETNKTPAFQTLDNKNTHITFLYIATENDTKEGIRLKESEFYTHYYNLGYNMINKVFPYYHSSLETGYFKKEETNSLESYLNYYLRTVHIKVDGLDSFELIHTLEKMGYVYNEKKHSWMKPEKINFYTNEYLKEKGDIQNEQSN